MSVYLKSFTFPSALEENEIMARPSSRFRMTCYPSFYPFGILADRGESIKNGPQFDFAPITILGRSKLRTRKRVGDKGHCRQSQSS